MLGRSGPRRPRLLAAAGLAAVVTAAAVALLHGPPVRAQQAPPDAISDSTDPDDVYRSDCAHCHGDDAEGTVRGPTLQGVGKASVLFQLASGRMPLAEPTAAIERHPPAYPPEVVDGLVAHVGDLGASSGPDVPDIDPARGDVAVGGELYRLNCAACHSWSGDGGALYQREAPSIHPATLTETAAVVRAGSRTMPAFGESAITDEELDGLVAYVELLGDPPDRGGNPLGHLGPVAEGAVALAVGLPVLLVATRWIGDRA